MEIRDESGNVVTEPDMSAGYLTQETETVHHDAVEAVDEVSHLETVKEYPGGGKEVRRVVDVEGVAAKPASDETVGYQVYHTWTQAQLDAREVEALKAKLFATDYIAAKIAEGAATKDDYAEVIAQRQTWRDRINVLRGDA